MIPVAKKVVNILPPAAIVDNASPTTNVIDTAGFRFLEVFVMFGAMDIAATVLKLQEADAASDATTLTSGADIVGTRAATDANDTGSTSVLPTATYDNLIVKFEIDLRGRKRYIKPVLTCGDGSAGTYVTMWGELSRGEVGPTTAAQKGLAQNFRVPVL